MGLEVSRAKGSYIYDVNNTPYLDFVAGVSACSLGHGHPKVVQAIKLQLDAYMHVMVYGEYVQSPSVKLTQLLAKHLPRAINTTYLTNSGTEAIEGAIKLARRYTGRSQIIAAKNAYHGNTMGAMSVADFKARKHPFLPLIPDVRFIEFNNTQAINEITNKTACVILETIQGGAGFIEPKPGYLAAVQQQCNAVGALLILDEIQPGIGRTGTMFGFEHYTCTPDIVVMGKGLGGGMPIGAFSASEQIMSALKNNPKLGHITTFGGHPVIAAAALATLKEITESTLMQQTLEKEALIRHYFKSHPLVLEIRGKGLMLALLLPSEAMVTDVILKAQKRGLILFWLLFELKAIRVTPPLTISNDELLKGCKIIAALLDEHLGDAKNKA